MAITRINTSQVSNYIGGSATNIAVAAQSLTTGNFIVVTSRTYISTPTVTSVTDTAGNTYIKAIGRAAPNTTTRVEIWYAYNVTGHASNVVTVNMSSSVQYYGVTTAQYSGILTTDPLDVTATGDAAATTSITSGAFTTTQADELIIAACDYDASVGQIWSPGAGYAISVQDDSLVQVQQEKIVYSIQTGVTASMTLGTARNLSMNVATFKGVTVGRTVNIGDNVKIGSTQVDKIYKGSSLVWYPYWENFQTTSRLTTINGSVIGNWDRIVDGSSTILNYNTAVNTHSCVWDNANSYSASVSFNVDAKVKINVGGVNPNQAHLVFGKQTGANFNQYAAVIDNRNGTLGSAAFQLRLNNSTTPLATSTVPVIAVGTWYRINIDWRTSGTRITARLYNSADVLLATITSNDTTYTSGRIGVQGFNGASFDNIRLIT